MKMTNRDYLELKNRVKSLHSSEFKEKYKRFSEMGYRWELFHQAVERELKNRLWEYLDDNNIDTGLKKIMRELA